jgi:predicted permease
MWNELRYTLKLIGRNIWFSLLCVTVLGIGIGIILPVYSYVDNTNFVKPPLAQGEHFVSFVKTTTPRQTTGFSRYDTFHYYYFKNGAKSFQTIAAWRDATVSVSDGELSEAYQRAEIEPLLMQQTGVLPILGRMFTVDDIASGVEPVALISYEVWQNYYAGRDDIIGLKGRIDGVIRTIIGVMPDEFTFPSTHQIWLPLALPPNSNAGEGEEDLVLTGILNENASIEEANREVQALQAQIKTDWPEQYKHFDTTLVLPFINLASGKSNPTANLIVLAVIILLVAFNIGNLFVARSEERIVELAVRSSLGASPRKIVRALMQESLLLCMLGLAVGFVLAYFGIRYVNGVLGNVNPLITSPFWWDMSLNARMVAVAIAAVLVIWLLSGGLPAWRMSRTDLNGLLSSSGKGVGATGSSRISKVLVNFQMMIGCVLLTVVLLQVIVMGNGRFITQQNGDALFTGTIAFDEVRHASAEARQLYLDNLARELSAQPGVEQSGLTTLMPGYGSRTIPYNAADQNLRVNDAYPRAYVGSVSSNYLAMLGVELLQGRNFGIEDSATSLPVAIVDQRLADTLWPGESALGKRLQLNPADNSPWLTIVGVMAPVIHESFLLEGQPGVPVIYQPIAQTNPAQVIVVLSSTQPGLDFRDVLRTAASLTDRDIPVTQIRSVRQQEQAIAAAGSSNQNISYAVVLLAIYLTGAATYGLAVRAANRRRIETGIRMALGATHAVSIALFLREGLKTVLIGLSIGAILSVLGSYLVIANNPVPLDAGKIMVPVISLIFFVMGSLVMLANYLPARKIVAMEPGDALRHE